MSSVAFVLESLKGNNMRVMVTLMHLELLRNILVIYMMNQ